ncbi:hypothetical protein KI387_006733, partial [Taxus chinensis]
MSGGRQNPTRNAIRVSMAQKQVGFARRRSMSGVLKGPTQENVSEGLQNLTQKDMWVSKSGKHVRDARGKKHVERSSGPDAHE